MQRPPSFGFWRGRTERLGGRGLSGIRQRAWAIHLRTEQMNTPGATSADRHPHMPMRQSVSRTTGSLCTSDPHSLSPGPISAFRFPLNRSAATRRLAVSVTLDSNQIPCAPTSSANWTGLSRHCTSGPRASSAHRSTSYPTTRPRRCQPRGSRFWRSTITPTGGRDPIHASASDELVVFRPYG